MQVALHGSRLENKPGLGFLVAEVLADHRDLGQDLSVVQHESRNVALGVWSSNNRRRRRSSCWGCQPARDRRCVRLPEPRCVTGASAAGSLGVQLEGASAALKNLESKMKSTEGKMAHKAALLDLKIERQLKLIASIEKMLAKLEAERQELLEQQRQERKSRRKRHGGLSRPPGAPPR
jgi:hypothetical protein